MPAPSTWVIPQIKKAIIVGVADMVATNDPGAELVTYSLGSCLGVTVYDPPPRVPKVTVTRKGDSLCQKGCYPMACVFLVSCSLAQ